MTSSFDPYTGYPSANVRDSKSFYSAYMQNAGTNSSSALLDISSIKLPGNTIRKLYPLLEYYATMDCSIAPAIQKMSLYPIMPLDFSLFKEETLRENAEDFFNNILNIHNTMSIMSLNWNVYGFAAVSLFFPFGGFLLARNVKIIFTQISSKTSSLKDFLFILSVLIVETVIKRKNTVILIMMINPRFVLLRGALMI